MMDEGEFERYLSHYEGKKLEEVVAAVYRCAFFAGAATEAEEWAEADLHKFRARGLQAMIARRLRETAKS